MVLFCAHIPFVVNCTFSTMPLERLQQYPGFKFQGWFSICLEIMSLPFLIKTSVTLDLKP